MAEAENKKLGRLMKKHGVRGSELARLIEADPSYVSHLLRGRRLPSLPMAKKIARVFQVRIEDIF